MGIRKPPQHGNYSVWLIRTTVYGSTAKLLCVQAGVPHRHAQRFYLRHVRELVSSELYYVIKNKPNEY